MKKIIIGILFSLIGLTAFAQDFIYREFEYRVIDPKKKTCKLLGTVSEDIEGDLEVREYVMYKDESYSVTSIGERAFSQCENLTSITLPNSIEQIQNRAFYGCKSLVYLRLSNSITAIPDGMCYYCSFLQSIEIPNSVVTIGKYAFEDCTSLASITLPEHLKSIDWMTFSGCSSLISISFPDSLTEISSQAFEYCSSLEKLELPKSLETIGDDAFSFCNKLSSVFIPPSVEEINFSPFAGCENLKFIDVDENNPNYASLDGLLYTKNLEKIIQCPAGLSSVNLADRLTEIGSGAFSYCNNLTQISLPSSVKKIGYNAFEGCEALQSINLPPSLEIIDSSAFLKCKSLKSIEIPPLVTKLESLTFGLCNSLEEVTIPAQHFVEVPTDYLFHNKWEFFLYNSPFWGCDPDMSLYVYEDFINEYKNEYGWTYFFSKILPIAGGSGVDSIPLDESKPFDVYSLSGVLVKEKAIKEDLRHLTPAVYILHQGASSKKVQVR